MFILLLLYDICRASGRLLYVLCMCPRKPRSLLYCGRLHVQRKMQDLSHGFVPVAAMFPPQVLDDIGKVTGVRELAVFKELQL